MSLVTDVIARLETQVPQLSGRIGTAMDLGLLMERDLRLPASPAGWVLPGSLQGRAAEDVLGAFRQTVTREVSVVLAVRTQDGRGAADRADIEALIEAVTAALVGFEPPSIAASARGTMALLRGDLVAIRAGIVVYSLDFAIADEWRAQ